MSYTENELVYSDDGEIIACPECTCYDDIEEVDDDKFVCKQCGHKFTIKTAYLLDLPYDPEIPSGCLACGGPYPDCKSSCNIFDD